MVAPIDGRVGKDEITVGNLIQGDAPDSPVLTTMVSIDPVYVAFEVDEQAYLKYLGAVRDAPLSADVGFADETGFPHQARLDFVDNQVVANTGTVRARAVLANPDRRFTPGLFVRVRLHAAGAAAPTVLVVDRAVGTDQNRRFVLVVGADHHANYREVHLGRQLGPLRVILNGLRAGEIVVVNGLQRVRPGSVVTPQTAPMEDPSTPSNAARG